MNLVSCHGFMKKPNSTVILNLQSYLVNYYFEKGLIIIKHNYIQLSSALNDVKLRIHAIDKKKIILWRAPHKFTQFQTK